MRKGIYKKTFCVYDRVYFLSRYQDCLDWLVSCIFLSRSGGVKEIQGVSDIEIG